MDDMSPIISEFLTESYENLDQLDQDLVDLEANPEEKSLLASIFRTIHTIKGTCGFLGFTKLESIAHVGENLLSKLRDGDLAMTQDIANSLLTMVDVIREILSNIESDQSEGDINYSDLVELMTYLHSGGNPESEKEMAVSETAMPMEKPPVDESQMLVEEPEAPALSGTLFEHIGGQMMLDSAIDIFYDKVLADERIKDFFDDVDTERLRNKLKEFLTFAFGGESKYTGKTLEEAHLPLVVALILDAMGLAQKKAHVVTEEDRDLVRKQIEDKETNQAVDRQTLLVFSPGNETRMAVPLSMVARLEEFPRDRVERSGEKEMVQYRGEIMPLIYLADVFGMSFTRKEVETLQVIVYSDQGRSVGVVVDSVIDIVEEVVTIKKGSLGHGLLGSAVIQGKVTDMLDVAGVIRQADPEFYENQLALASKD